VFLDADAVKLIHHRQIDLFGGDPGLSDNNLLESAVAAPQHLFIYDEDADIFDLAASYCFHIARNHAFVDGNKRAGFASAITFLEINTLLIRPTNDEKHGFTEGFFAKLVERIAAGEANQKLLSTALFLSCAQDLMRAITATASAACSSPIDREFTSKEEAHAYVADRVLSSIGVAYIESCQHLGINSKRFHKSDDAGRQAVVDLIDPKFQKEFGMVIQDLDNFLP